MQAFPYFLNILACLVTCGGMDLSSGGGTIDPTGREIDFRVTGFEVIGCPAPFRLPPDCVFASRGESEINGDETDSVGIPPGFSQPDSETFTFQRTRFSSRSLGDRVSPVTSPVALVLRC
jgi:hypothetical protein